MSYFKYFLSIFLILVISIGCSNNSNCPFILPAKITSIQVTPADISVPKGVTGTYTAIAYYSNNTSKDVTQEVQWSSDNNLPVSISNEDNTSGFAQALEVGQSIITATLNDVTSNEANVEVTNANLTKIEVTPLKIIAAKGVKVQYKAIGIYSDNSHHNLTLFVNWSSLNEIVATIDNNLFHKGLASTLNIGETKIRATFENMTSNEASLIVTGAIATSLQITPADTVVPKGTSGPYTATAYFSDNTSADVTAQSTWLSKDASIVSIITSGDDAGYAEANNVGQTTITATYNGLTSNIANVEVTDARLQSIEVSPIDKTVSKGLFVQYKAIGKYSDNTFKDITLISTWKSDNLSVATIDSRATAHAINVGQTNITASFQSTISNQAKLTVTSAVATSLQITPANKVVPKGTTGTYTAIAYYSDGSSSDVTSLSTWASANSEIVSITNSGDDAGYAQALTIGQTTISAVYNYINSNIANVEVSSATLTQLIVSPTVDTTAKGLYVQYTAIGIYSDTNHKDLTKFSTWFSSNTEVATIDNLGSAQAINLGTSNISASFDSISSNIANLVVTDAKTTSLQIIQDNVKAPKGTTGRYTAIAYYSDGTSQDVTALSTWNSADTDTVGIISSGDEAGLAKALEVGSTTVLAYYKSLTSNTAFAEVTSTTLEKINISPILTTTAKGTSVQYKAIGIYSDSSSLDITDSVTWKSTDTSIATINETGLANTINLGTTTITASLNSVISEAATLNVTDASITSIQVSPASLTMATHSQYNLLATAFYSDGTSSDVTQSSTWISSDDSIVSVITSGTDGGLLNALMAGSSEITAKLDTISSNIAKITVEGKTIDNIQITPHNDSFSVGAKKQYRVDAIYTDLSVKDITSLTQIQSDDTAVAVFDETNMMTAIGTGRAGLTTIYQGITSQTSFTHVLDHTLEGIQITPADVEVVVGTQGNYEAIGYYADGSTDNITNTVTWVSDAPEIASIIASGTDGGTATALEVGNANITASLDSITSNIAKATVIQETIQEILVTPISTTVVNGISVQYTATAIYSNEHEQDITNLASWSCDTDIATITSTGMALTHSAGTTDIKASLDEIVGTASLTVTDVTLESIQVTPADIEVPLGTQGRFTATGYYSDKSSHDITDISTWISSDTTVVSIVASGDEAGLADATAVGTSKITASLDGISSNEATVTVGDKTIKNVQITPNNLQMDKGTTQQYKVTVVYMDNTTKDVTEFAQIQSLKTDVAIFDENNIATAVDVGDTELTTTYDEVQSERDFLHVIEPSLTDITLSPSVAQLGVGGTKEYIAIAHYSDGSSQDVSVDATWSTTDPSVATGYKLDNKVIAEATNDGNTQITAKFKTIDSNTATLAVHTLGAGNPIDYISIEPLNETIESGTTLQYKAIAHYRNGRQGDLEDIDSWISSDTSVATISTSGLAEAIVFGATTITANYHEFSADTSLNVIGDCGNSKPEEIFIVPADSTLSVAAQLQYQLWGIWSNGCEMQLSKNNAQNWSSGDTAIVSIDHKSGLALGLANGTTTINADYQSLTTSTGIEVLGGEEVLSVSIQPAPSATIVKKATQDYVCSARTAINGVEQPEKFVTGEASFTSSDTKIATIGLNDGTRQYVDAKNKAGHTTITCFYGGKNSSSSLDVE